MPPHLGKIRFWNRHRGGEAPNSEAEVPLVLPDGNSGLATNGGSNLNRKDAREQRLPEGAHKMRRGLQKALKQPVILVAEQWHDRLKRRAVKYRRPVTGVGFIGVSIAAVVVTAGGAAPILGVIAASVPVADSLISLATDMLDPSPVILEMDAVERLVKILNEGQRVKVVRAAIDSKRSTVPDGSVTLSESDIEQAEESLKKQVAPHVPNGRVGVGLQMGLTVIGAGLVLLALTLIPQDIHGLMSRAASAILVVGALIVGAAVVNGSWLKGVDRPGHDG